MPRYDYRCLHCGINFEATHPMTTPRGAACPTCGEPAKPLVGNAAVVFRGPGFHTTDYPRIIDDPGPARSQEPPAPNPPQVTDPVGYPNEPLKRRRS